MKKVFWCLIYGIIIVCSFRLYGTFFRWFIYSESILSFLLCSIDGFILSASVLDLIDNIKS